MPSVRASKHRTPFLIHSSTAKRELYMNRRGEIHFRAFGMRRSCTTTFRVTQVHQDHVQIIDEKKQAAWNTFCQSADYQSTRQELRNAVQQAQMISDESKALHQQSLCKQCKSQNELCSNKAAQGTGCIAQLPVAGLFLRCSVRFHLLVSIRTW